MSCKYCKGKYCNPHETPQTPLVVDLKKLEKERIEAEKILLDEFLNGGRFRV